MIIYTNLAKSIWSQCSDISGNSLKFLFVCFYTRVSRHLCLNTLSEQQFSFRHRTTETHLYKQY